IALVIVRAVDARENQAALERLPLERRAVLRDQRVDRVGGVLIETNRLLIVDFPKAVFVLETQAVVQRELRRHAPVVLHVGAPVARVPFTGTVVVRGLSAGRKPEQQAGDLVAAAAVVAGERGAEIEVASE